MTDTKNEPVAYYIYVAEHQNGYVVESLDDACYDLTNHGAVSTPLYASPQPQFTPEQLQSVLDALRIGEFQVHVVCSKLVLGSPIHQVMLGQYEKVRSAIAILKGVI